MFNDILNKILLIFAMLCWVCMIIRFFSNRRAPEKEVKAEVCDKYRKNTVSKYPGTSPAYVVVFNTSGGKLSFRVSEYSYNNYNINDKGMLKYKGDRIIDFS